LRLLEKRWIYSYRVSSGLFLQLWRSHEFPGQVYIPWKWPMKTERRSPQQRMLPNLIEIEEGTKW
jgi:hypothetical protein